MCVSGAATRRWRNLRPKDQNLPKKKFYPEQVAKDTVAIFGWFAVLMGLAILCARSAGAHGGSPTDSSYVARPEWYLLFLFQFLKWFNGPLKVLAAVMLPALAIVAMLLVPFIDRGEMKTLRRRWGAIGLAALATIFWGGLTARAVATTPQSHEMDMSLVKPWQEISAGNLASIGFFRKAQVRRVAMRWGTPVREPDLTLCSTSLGRADWLEAHIKSSTKRAGSADGRRR